MMKPIKAVNHSHQQKHHNPEQRKQLGYVHQNLTAYNERWDREYKANGNPKSITNYFTAIKKNVKEKTGRAIQDKAADLAIQDAVVVIDEQTTMEDLKRFAKRMEVEFGFTCIQINIHRDEGYIKKKDKMNLHAHVIFETVNRETGKSWKPKADRGSRMQDMAAEALGMVRGTTKYITKKEGLNAWEYKEEQARIHEAKLQEENRKLEARKETVGKEVKDAEAEKKAIEQEADALIEKAERELSEIKTAGEIRREEASKALDGAFGAVTGYFQGVGKKAKKARQTLKEHAERIPEIEEGKRIIERSKELTGQNKPQMDEIIARHTKETFWGNKKIDYKAVFSDYREIKETEENALKAKLNAKNQEVNLKVFNHKSEVDRLNSKIERLEKTIQNQKAQRDYIEKRIAKTLGDTFTQLWTDCMSYFKDYYDHLATAVSLWFGNTFTIPHENDHRLDEKYSANRQEGRLLINGNTIDQWEVKRERIEETIEQENKKQRNGYGYGIKIGR